MAENRSWLRAKHSGNYVNGENPELTARRRSLLEEYAKAPTAENRSWVRAKHSGNYVNGENRKLTARRRSLLEEYAKAPTEVFAVIKKPGFGPIALVTGAVFSPESNFLDRVGCVR